MKEPPLTSELLLEAYAIGYFPMAESRDGAELHWFYPKRRGIIPLDAFHISASLARLARKKPFTITTDKAFRDVMLGCAERPETWINDEILKLYCELAEKGHAHSVECRQGEKLVGGIYGVAIGGAFFGESMFSRVSGASKIALMHLVQLLREAGYQLFDTQYVNDHLEQFGVMGIAQEKYLKLLKKAMAVTPKRCF